MMEDQEITMQENTTVINTPPKVKSEKKTNKISIKLSKKNEEMINHGLKKYIKIIKMAKEKWLNESDTSNIINDMLNEIRWYDKIYDITTEYKIRNQFCDYWIKINNKLNLLIEVKAITVDLNDNHLFQANSYASTEGIKRVILTNLRERRLYHLSFGSRIDDELVLSISLLWEEDKKKLIEQSKYIHKESFIKKYVEKIYQQKMATSKNNFRKVLLSLPVIKKIQSELRAISGIKVPEQEIQIVIKWLLEK